MSVAVHVIFVIPIGNLSPGLKFEIIVTLSPELSIADGCGHHITAVGSPGSVFTSMFDGTCMNIGFSLSVFDTNDFFFRLRLFPL